MNDNEFKNVTKWDNAWEEKEDALAIEYSDEDIAACGKSIYDYICANMKIDYFQRSDDGCCLVVEIPEGVHPLVSKRFDNSFTNDSRDSMMEKIIDSFVCCSIDHTDTLNSAIKQLGFKNIGSTEDHDIITGHYEMSGISLDDGVYMGDDQHSFEAFIDLAEVFDDSKD
jgi:hypothetical protein